MKTNWMRFLRNRPLPVLRLIAVVVLLARDTPAGGADAYPLSDFLAGHEFIQTVQKSESLTSVGAKFGVEVTFLAAANGLRRSISLKENQQLRIDNRHIVPPLIHDGILINIPQRMLFHFRQGQLLQYYSVGLGRPDWRTPTGPFKIVTKVENPIWDVPKSIQEEMRREGKVVQERVPPCPENPLGIQEGVARDVTAKITQK